MLQKGSNLIKHFKKVDLPDPADEVIRQIRKLIQDGILKPGNRLPSEKKIEERTGIPRGQISRALRRLETYGVLRTVPQSGTYVSDIGVTALEGLISNLIKAEEKDLKDLAETRLKLEELAVTLVVQRASDEEIAELTKVQQVIADNIARGRADIDDDMVFHIKLAEYSKNTTLKATLSLLTVDFIQAIKNMHALYNENKLGKRLVQASQEHKEIIEAIQKRDVEGAVRALRKHFQKAAEFSLQ